MTNLELFTDHRDSRQGKRQRRRERPSQPDVGRDAPSVVVRLDRRRLSVAGRRKRASQTAPISAATTAAAAARASPPSHASLLPPRGHEQGDNVDQHDVWIVRDAENKRRTRDASGRRSRGMQRMRRSRHRRRRGSTIRFRSRRLRLLQRVVEQSAPVFVSG